MTQLHDAQRRQLLLTGISLLGLPLLDACGGSGGNDAPIDEPGGPVDPTPATHPPRALHASFTDDPTTTRTVSWFTDGLDDPGSVIEYGPVDAGMSAEEIANAPFPARAEGVSKSVYGVDALTHSAVATAVPADRAMRYRVGSTKGWSAVQLLQPAPASGFRFVHFGDHATNAASRAVVQAVAARQPDFVLIAGDLSYANGDQAVWDQYFAMLEPLASGYPVMTAPGNHEAKDGGGEGYRSRLAQPGNITWYAFDYQNVHYFFSTGGSLVDGLAGAGDLAAELLAIELDLAQAALRRARGEIDFIIFVQHYPIWTDEDGRDPADFTLVLLEEQFLLRYGVDLLLVGHDHIYERSKPMAYGRPLDGGYVQVTQGGGGQDLYTILPQLASWSAFATVRYGFSEYQVQGQTISINSHAIDDEKNQLLAGGATQIIDRFEVASRNSAARLAYARPARAKNELLKNLDAIIRHTQRRNAFHDAVESGAVVVPAI
ncbi:metallophosphoesterase [Hydrocarboniphaga sp.]|uniref:metallophosphoesterase n=1 Tax=Hydrocarboniphaga sp. TaxID=2033016 RepID=UPI003D0A7125